MTMTTDNARRPRLRTDTPAAASSSTSTTPARRLQTSFAAARVSFTWLGVRKSLSTEQKAQAAESFGAEGQYLSAAKKLLDTNHPAFKAVGSVRSQIQAYWRGMSLPYPEPGLRLLRQQDIESFNARMAEMQAALAEAVERLDLHYGDLKDAAQGRLGSLYNPADYPASLQGLFEVVWDFPSVEPPEYLLRLNPELYQQEKARMTARFEEAVRLAEQAFVSELAALVEHLVERLGTEADGTRKVFRDTAIGNLTEFFDRFKSLSVGSNADLDKLVETARRAISGVDPQAVRDNSGLRQQVAAQLSAVSATLDQMLVDQPRRKILRTTQPAQAAHAAGGA